MSVTDLKRDVQAADTAQVDREDVFIFTYLSSEMAADIGITSTMLFKLLNSRTGWQNTDRTLFRVARIVAETQLPPTVFTAVLMSFVAADAVGKTNTITAFFLSAFVSTTGSAIADSPQVLAQSIRVVCAVRLDHSAQYARARRPHIGCIDECGSPSTSASQEPKLTGQGRVCIQDSAHW